MTRRRRSPRPLAVALGTASESWAPDTLLAEVQREWPGLVGAAIAAEASPAWEHRGVLTVSCSASVWAQELDLMAPTILERLNGRIERGSIDRLRCVTLPVDGGPPG